MLRLWNGLPKPVIGRVQGNAYGGELGLISVCDFAVVAETARFALTETRLGLIPATIGPFVLRKLGEGFARQVLFSGTSFGADFALRSSLAACITSESDLNAAEEEAVGSALQSVPGAAAEAKAFCRYGGTVAPVLEAATVANALASRWETREAQAGIDASFSKSPPPWRTADAGKAGEAKNAG